MNDIYSPTNKGFNNFHFLKITVNYLNFHFHIQFIKHVSKKVSNIPKISALINYK